LNSLKQSNVKGQDTSAAHSALQYIISKALLEGKIGQTILEIPMIDLFTEFEGPKFVPESAALVLRLEINTSWTSGSPDGEFAVDLEGEIGFDDIVENGEDDDNDELN
jgi:hypothetical protein